jgi:hypothetical protein
MGKSLRSLRRRHLLAKPPHFDDVDGSRAVGKEQLTLKIDLEGATGRNYVYQHPSHTQRKGMATMDIEGLTFEQAKAVRQSLQGSLGYHPLQRRAEKAGFPGRRFPIRAQAKGIRRGALALRGPALPICASRVVRQPKTYENRLSSVVDARALALRTAFRPASAQYDSRQVA